MQQTQLAIKTSIPMAPLFSPASSDLISILYLAIYKLTFQDLKSVWKITLDLNIGQNLIDN